MAGAPKKLQTEFNINTFLSTKNLKKNTYNENIIEVLRFIQNRNPDFLKDEKINEGTFFDKNTIINNLGSRVLEV